MKIERLFESYEKEINLKPGIDKVFEDSDMENKFKQLDFGFFPIGSGVLIEGKSKINIAEIESCEILVLGNDWGTLEDFNEIKEKNPDMVKRFSNPTIRNLLSGGLDLKRETTFFSNLFMGLRKEGTLTKRKIELKEDFKNVCFDFLKIQLDFMSPKIVLCLGKEVMSSLSKKCKPVFGDFNFKNNKIETKDKFCGTRKFIGIKHPSMANSNWKPFEKYVEEIKDLIKD